MTGSVIKNAILGRTKLQAPTLNNIYRYSNCHINFSPGRLLVNPLSVRLTFLNLQQPHGLLAVCLLA